MNVKRGIMEWLASIASAKSDRAAPVPNLAFHADCGVLEGACRFIGWSGGNCPGWSEGPGGPQRSNPEYLEKDDVTISAVTLERSTGALGPIGRPEARPLEAQQRIAHRASRPKLDRSERAEHHGSPAGGVTDIG
jgi:hypothetical protein